MKEPIVLEGEAVLHDREGQLAVTVDDTALTWVFEQDLGVAAAIEIGGRLLRPAKTKRVRVTIEELEE